MGWKELAELEWLEVNYRRRQELGSEIERIMLEEVGLTDHPKAHAVFMFAYELGHSEGYAEVFDYLQDLAELIN